MIDMFKYLQHQYAPLIDNIIASDKKFYQLNDIIRWRFCYDERVAIFATCNKDTKVITVNIAAVDFAFQRNEPLHVEYFLLHEIRHICQYIEIEKYRINSAECINKEMARKWSDEQKDYVPAVDNLGKTNSAYFTQTMEMDAFAFAYSVMNYKYGKVPYLQIPMAYMNSEFKKMVDEWMTRFKSEGK